MKFINKPIEPERVPQLCSQGLSMAKAANPVVEQLRCFYTKKDANKIIYMRTFLDLIDSPPAPNEIEKFFLSQMIV